MKKNILILEDNIAQLTRLGNLIREAEPEINIVPSKSYAEAYSLIKSVDNIILFAIDIDLGDNPDYKDGLDFARYVRSCPEYEFTPIVYITSVSDRLEEALTTTHCYEYIKKPYVDNDVIEVVRNILRFPSSTPIKLDLKGINGMRIRLEPGKIAYIESFGHDIILHTENGIQVTRSYSIKSIESLLPDYFYRCHKSYIINIRYYTGYDTSNNFVFLSGYKEKIPVGRKFRSGILSIITKSSQ